MKNINDDNFKIIHNYFWLTDRLMNLKWFNFIEWYEFKDFCYNSLLWFIFNWWFWKFEIVESWWTFWEQYEIFNVNFNEIYWYVEVLFYNIKEK